MSALDNPHAPDFLEVAVPVTGHRDQVLAALSASARHEFFPEETVADKIVPQLLRAAAAARSALSLG